MKTFPRIAAMCVTLIFIQGIDGVHELWAQQKPKGISAPGSLLPTSGNHKVDTPRYVSKVWVADNGDGTYKNPILHADYSDPDAISVGDDFYMTASSFNASPGLPLLHSKDLVNWKLVGYAFQRQLPDGHFSAVRHGEGVWAPSIRYHKGSFYIYYPDPDFGIYVTKARNITGPWSVPVLVEAGKGLIDPCPLWDEDGQAYLAYAYAGSRAGIKSILCVKPLSPDGMQTFGQAVMVHSGHGTDETVEGPKIYKRNGWYYIWAPAGGVATGWQIVLRSRNIYGPYERRVILQQGKSPVNGPHQGAWVTTAQGEDWFLHFQDKDAYGRIVHLQPLTWKNDWPVAGIDKDGTGTGEPVPVHKKPKTKVTQPLSTPAETDEFNSPAIGLQWQWQANPQNNWGFPTANGFLRLFATQREDSSENLWNLPNLLSQKFPAEEFSMVTKLKFTPHTEGERVGLMIFGMDYAWIGLEKRGNEIVVTRNTCLNADKGGKESAIPPIKAQSAEIFLKVTVRKGAVCTFYYGYDGKNFTAAGEPFTAKKGRWVGAKAGIFCSRNIKINDAGFADFDWVRVEKGE